MKTWLRGDRWEVQPGQVLSRFPIRSDKFDENELILPFHLTGEGFPSIWGSAHAFSIRLNHSLLKLEGADAVYREQCRQAALTLLNLVVAQFLGLFKLDEIELSSESGEAASAAKSQFIGLLSQNLVSERRKLPALVVLRDPRLKDAPIAAINYPDCLWFPVHSYKLELISSRVEDILGRIEIDGLIPTKRRPEDEVRALVGQLRAYLREVHAEKGASRLDKPSFS